MSTIPPAPILPPVPRAVKSTLADDADTGMKSPIYEIFSLFLLKPALLDVYYNFKTWCHIGRTLSKISGEPEKTAARLTKELSYLQKRTVERLRTRLYFSRKMDLEGKIKILLDQLKSCYTEDVRTEATRLLSTVRKRALVRLGFSLAQLACKVGFAAGAIFALMTPLSWKGLVVLASAGAISLLVTGINWLCLNRNPYKRPQ